jgi:hypothetical protein
VADGVDRAHLAGIAPFDPRGGSEAGGPDGADPGRVEEIVGAALEIGRHRADERDFRGPEGRALREELPPAGRVVGQCGGLVRVGSGGQRGRSEQEEQRQPGREQRPQRLAREPPPQLLPLVRAWRTAWRRSSGLNGFGSTGTREAARKPA